MLNKIIQWSISNKLIVGILTLGLIVWGVISLQILTSERTVPLI